MSRKRIVALLLVAFSTGLAGCGMPKDPRGTSAVVHSRPVRIGVSDNPPWVVLDDTGEPRGVEPELARRFAAAQDVRVQWVAGGEGALLEDLHQGRLDLVLGGLSERTPWKGRVGLSKAYAQDSRERRVWATAPGENRWLLQVDRFLAGQRDAIPALGAQRP